MPTERLGKLRHNARRAKAEAVRTMSWMGRRPTFTSVLVHQLEAAGTQALVANLEVLADVGAATIVVQALVGPCTGLSRHRSVILEPLTLHWKH